MKLQTQTAENILHMVNNKSKLKKKKIDSVAECEFFNIEALHASSI